jgi:hypothetical protein
MLSDAKIPNRVRTRQSRLILLAVLILAAAAFFLPYFLGSSSIAPGEGPDEIAHLDNIFFRFTRPWSALLIGRGLVTPGLAPQGQGHQAPFSYLLSAALLHLVLSPADVAPFWDYQAGLKYSSAGWAMGGGPSPCNVRLNPVASADTLRIRRGISMLRTENALFFAGAVLLMFVAAGLFFPDQPLLMLATCALYAGNPTALWRSTFVTNDNLLALLAIVPFISALLFLRSGEMRCLLLSTLSAALCFLTKYSGIACLSCILSAILLRPGVSLRRRSAELACTGTLFSMAVAAEIFKNLRTEGEPLLFRTVAREFPWLYHPSSLRSLLFDSAYIRTMCSRFWLEFHNLGYFDPTFPVWRFTVWQYLSSAAVLGLGIFLFQPSARRRYGRAAALALASCLGILAVIIDFALAFPLAGGRYLHPMQAEISLLVVLGISSLLSPLIRRPDRGAWAVLGICLLYALLGFETTATFQTKKYASCRFATAADVDAGVNFGAADLDGDGIDEIFAFRHLPSRVFFLQKTGARYVLRADWTRDFGLPGDVMFSAKINIKNRASVMTVYRPTGRELFFARPEDFLAYHPALSAYPESALAITSLWLSRENLRPKSTPLAGDADALPGDEVLLFNPANKYWMVLKPVETPQGLTVRRTADTFLGGRHGQPLVLSGPELVDRLATYRPQDGVLRISGLQAQSYKERFQIEPGLRLLPADVDGDGYSELLSWRKGDSCLRVIELPRRKGETLRQSKQRVCLQHSTQPFPLQEYHEVFVLRNGSRETADTLAAGDKRTGVVFLFALSHSADEAAVRAEEADFGFLRPEERIQAFRG